MGKVHRDRVQRASGEIHHLFRCIKHGAEVLHFKRVAKFYAKMQATFTCSAFQRMQHRHSCIVLKVVRKGGIRHHHIVVSQLIIE